MIEENFDEDVEIYIENELSNSSNITDNFKENNHGYDHINSEIPNQKEIEQMKELKEIQTNFESSNSNENKANNTNNNNIQIFNKKIDSKNNELNHSIKSKNNPNNSNNSLIQNSCNSNTKNINTTLIKQKKNLQDKPLMNSYIKKIEEIKAHINKPCNNNEKKHEQLSEKLSKTSNNTKFKSYNGSHKKNHSEAVDTSHRKETQSTTSIISSNKESSTKMYILEQNFSCAMKIFTPVSFEEFIEILIKDLKKDEKVHGTFEGHNVYSIFRVEYLNKLGFGLALREQELIEKIKNNLSIFMKEYHNESNRKIANENKEIQAVEKQKEKISKNFFNKETINLENLEYPPKKNIIKIPKEILNNKDKYNSELKSKLYESEIIKNRNFFKKSECLRNLKNVFY
jgi:hypothetical protein